MEMWAKKAVVNGPCRSPLNFTVLSTYGRKTKDIQPNVLSDVLLAEYILKKEQNQGFKIDPRWNASESFDDYIVLYKIALVLLALLNMERKNQEFFQVRSIFEKAVFTDRNIQKLFFYHDVKSTLGKLGELLDTSNRNLNNLRDQNEKMPWTMACLRTAKVLEDNQAIMHSRSAVIGMGWAMAWLKEAGIIETNPSILSQYALMWMDNYVTISRFLQRLRHDNRGDKGHRRIRALTGAV